MIKICRTISFVSFDALHCTVVDTTLLAMGNFTTKMHDRHPKMNKNHNRQKMFRFGVSFGRDQMNIEGHIQMGYNSKTIKNYERVGGSITESENGTSCIEDVSNHR